jgi:hypothetical protein
MKIPSMFYGRASQVMSRARKAARNLVRTRAFDAFDPGSFVDTTEVDGLILVDFELAPSDRNHFHCYTFAEALADAATASERRQLMKDWLLWSLPEEWRFACALAGRANVALLSREPALARTYVEAAIHHWPAFSSLGPRFGPTIDGNGQELLNGWFTLYYALGVLGLSNSDMMVSPRRTPAELLKLVDDRGTPP